MSDQTTTSSNFIRTTQPPIFFKTIYSHLTKYRPICLSSLIYKKSTFLSDTVKPLIKNTSEEFIKCRLENCSMSFITLISVFAKINK